MVQGSNRGLYSLICLLGEGMSCFDVSWEMKKGRVEWRGEEMRESVCFGCVVFGYVSQGYR